MSDWKVSDKKIKELVDMKQNKKRHLPRGIFPKKFTGSTQWVES